MNLEMIETTDAALSTLQKSALTEAITLLERSMREIRVISHLLHPPLLDEIGLQAVVPWYLNSFSERSGIQIDLDMPSDISKRSEEHTSELQSLRHLVCRLLLEKKKKSYDDVCEYDRWCC